MNHALSFLLAEAGHGISVAVGLGNAVDVDSRRRTRLPADDRRTTAVALHIESVADGPRLADAVARLSAVKPVVAWLSGATMSVSSRSRTPAHWPPPGVRHGPRSRQAGAVLVDDERELVDAVGALSLTRLPLPPTRVSEW